VKFDPDKWYFNTYAYVVIFLCIGPFALPLVWVNPRYDRAKKILITVLTLIVSFFLAVSLAKSAESIIKYYQQAFQLSKEGFR